MAQINVQFLDHDYQYDVRFLPRIGETVEISGETYKVTHVLHDLDSEGYVTIRVKKGRAR